MRYKKTMKTSIIITCYNLGAYLAEALESALQSASPDFDVIVVDDGSSEAQTRAELERLQKQYAADARVRFIHQSNQGLAAARNTGIEAATGELILPLDADDKLRPTFIPKAAQLMTDNPAVGVVHGWGERFGIRSGVWELPPVETARILLGNCVPACSVFRKQIWTAVGGYDVAGFREGYEDWDFWLGALERGWQFQLVPEVVFDYRIRPGSMVSACNEPAVRQKLVTTLIEKHKELYASCWPDLLIRRELSTLEYEKAVAGYHQRYVEAQADFQHFAKEWNARCERLESQVAAQHEQLHQLRHITGIMRQLGRIIARLRSVAAPR